MFQFISVENISISYVFCNYSNIHKPNICELTEIQSFHTLRVIENISTTDHMYVLKHITHLPNSDHVNIMVSITACSLRVSYVAILHQ